VLGGQRYDLLGGELPQPFAVEPHRCQRRVQDLVYLRCIGLGIGHNVFARERLAGFGFPGWIADHTGEIADDQEHLMAEFLKLPQLMQDNGVSKMDVRRGWIETKLDSEGCAGRRRALEFSA
jgi:hypothetical protein